MLSFVSHKYTNSIKRKLFFTATPNFSVILLIIDFGLTFLFSNTTHTTNLA